MDYASAKKAVEEFQQLLRESQNVYAKYRAAISQSSRVRLREIPEWTDSEAQINRRIPQIEAIVNELDNRLAAKFDNVPRNTWPHGPKIEVCERILEIIENHHETQQILNLANPNISSYDYWLPDCVRVFISHLSHEKELAYEVSNKLLEIGLQGFVAHEHIEVSREWQDEIQLALRTADVFVGLVHPGFSSSPWTQQEVGWASGRDIPILMVRIGEDPKGFPAKVQWPSGYNKKASQWHQ